MVFPIATEFDGKGEENTPDPITFSIGEARYPNEATGVSDR